MGAKDLGGESRNRTHVAGISGPICFRGSAITALASLRNPWRKVSDSNARGAHAPIRLATGANRPLWQPSDAPRYAWEADSNQRQPLGQPCMRAFRILNRNERFPQGRADNELQHPPREFRVLQPNC